MRAYYAHCMALYGTPQERRDHDTIAALGFTLSCPNAPDIEAKVNAARAAEEDFWWIFEQMIDDADVVIFRALPDGSIPAGVAHEVLYAQNKGVPIIELPSGLSRRIITLEQTREYLKEVGQR